MNSIFDDDIWDDEIWDENEPTIIDCAVLECKGKGPAYLCMEHLGLFYERHPKFLVCWECNSLVKLLPPNYGSSNDIFSNKKFIFCERCRNCGDINDERKIVLDEKKRIL